MIVKIFIDTNSVRNETSIEINSDCSAEELLLTIKDELENKGLYVSNGNLLSDNGCKITNENILQFVVDKILIIKYRNIVTPNGAKFYDYFKGINYFFHSSETQHLNYPHVHAKYNGEVISISLTNFTVVGRFSNKQKMNQAIKYVIKHKEDLMEKWHQWVSKY